MNLLEPTTGELDAAERVLAEVHNSAPDGYWRDLGRAVLEAAKEAEFNQFLADLNREESFDRATGEGRR